MYIVIYSPVAVCDQHDIYFFAVKWVLKQRWENDHIVIEELSFAMDIFKYKHKLAYDIGIHWQI